MIRKSKGDEFILLRYLILSFWFFFFESFERSLPLSDLRISTKWISLNHVPGLSLYYCQLIWYGPHLSSAHPCWSNRSYSHLHRHLQIQTAKFVEFSRLLLGGFQLAISLFQLDFLRLWNSQISQEFYLKDSSKTGLFIKWLLQICFQIASTSRSPIAAVLSFLYSKTKRTSLLNLVKVPGA